MKLMNSVTEERVIFEFLLITLLLQVLLYPGFNTLEIAVVHKYNEM